MKRRWTDWVLLCLILAALPVLAILAMGLYFARLMVNPPRARLYKTPQGDGLVYDDVCFEASDGTPISAWFIPAPGDGPRPAVAMVHGWPWNRLGNAGDSLLDRVTRPPRVDLLKPARALHDAGYHVLMLDLRNHGRSGSSPTVTFGHDEARDVLGAVDYLTRREDVDAEHIGALGYSMGANAVMFACTETKLIEAAIAVQPVRPVSFANRMSSDLMGPLSKATLRVAQWAYYRAGGPLMETTDPDIVADRLYAAIMYVQGDGDPWGDVPNVRRFYERGQEPKALEIVPSTHRFGGYLYLGEHPEAMLAFFKKHLSEQHG